MKRALLLGICFCMFWSFAAGQAQVEGSSVREPNTFTLGPGGDYTTFTQAIQYLNGMASIPAPGITFLVSSGATFNENPPAIVRSASEAAPVVFQKNGDGENPKILATGTTSSGEAIIRLDGAKYYTFDGIDVANAGSTRAMEYGYYLVSGASYNSIKNCKITLDRGTVNSRGVYTYSTRTGVCHHNLYQNLEITNARSGVYHYGSNTTTHTHETVQNCIITGVSSFGIYATYGTNLVIRNNQISPVDRNSGSFIAIHFGGVGSSGLVEGNQIVTNERFTGHFWGINFTRGDAIIHNNYIGNISGGTYDVIGIRVEGNATVSQNTITGFSSIGGSLVGVETQSAAGNTQVLGNLISNFECRITHNYGSSATGMILGGSNCLAANNMIEGLNFNSSLQPSSTGIRTVSGNTRLYYNSIRLEAEAFRTTSSSACVHVQSEGSNVELINNIMANYSVPGSSGKTVCLWKDSADFSGLSAECSNNLFWLGGNGSNYLVAKLPSASYQTLAEYQAASGLEQNSLFAEPAFVSDSDLHLDPEAECAAKNNALPLTAVNIDFDGQLRDAETPDIGADEASAMPADPWEVMATELDFGYVCSGASPAQGILTISNQSTGTLVFDASCFTLEGSACFELRTEVLTIPPLSTGELQLSFGGIGIGEKVGNLIISKAGITRTVSLSGILNTALVMPVKADWESSFEGWIPMDVEQNKWQISDEQSFKGDAALVASATESSLIHLFADVVLPAESPRLIVNLLHNGLDTQDFGLWLVETNYTPQAGSLPTGQQLSADLGAANQWNRVEYSIPSSYVGQTVRLVLSLNAAPSAKIHLDNLRVLGAAQQPAPPQQVQFIKLDQGAKVTWQAQADANEYLVESSTLSTEGFTPLQHTGNTELPVSIDGDKCFYRVIAFE